MQKNERANPSEFASEFSPGSRKSLEFSDRLKAQREAQGMTQQALANKLGISLSSVQNYESGKLPRGEHLLSLAKVLGCSLDGLLLGEQEGTPRPPSSSQTVVGETSPDEFKMSDMLTKTAAVLESDSIYRTALASNINAFHQAVRSERTLARLEERMDVLEREMGELRRENRELKQHQEQLSQANKASNGE